MKPVLEVCTHSVESAVSAERGGAMRLELCANLMIGGTSPDEDLFRMVRERVSVQFVCCFVRAAAIFCIRKANLSCSAVR